MKLFMCKLIFFYKNGNPFNISTAHPLFTSQNRTRETSSKIMNPGENVAISFATLPFNDKLFECS